MKLPERVHEKFVHPWWSTIVKRLPHGLSPTEVILRPFHDYVTVFWAYAQDANKDAAALRFGLKLTTRDGAEANIIVIPDRPPPIQHRGRGIHPYYKVILDHALQDGEEARPPHRGRGQNPHSTFHAVNANSGRWKDDDLDANAIVITEVIPDDGLADVVKQKFKALLSA